tara:strand:- start:1066 stop:1875 length:810 start_codon:yes stop_codon:yes gene_type:complete
MKEKESISVLVIGEECLDRFVYGKSERLCPDIPAPVFIPEKIVENRGMAGNVYNNLVSLNHERYCHRLVIPTETITKERYVDRQTNYTFLRVDRNDRVPPISFIGSDLNRKRLSRYEAIVIVDYGKGFLNEEAIEHICNLNENVFLDTKKVLGDFCKKAKIIKMNSPEFERVKSKINLDDWKDKLIVTLGKNGCMYLRGTDVSGFRHYSTDPVEVFDAAGAGDTFLAALVSKYLRADNMDEAIKFANNKSKDAVQQKGVSIINEGKSAK